VGSWHGGQLARVGNSPVGYVIRVTTFLNFKSSIRRIISICESRHVKFDKSREMKCALVPIGHSASGTGYQRPGPLHLSAPRT
jgi:hypothetical protein